MKVVSFIFLCCIQLFLISLCCSQKKPYDGLENELTININPGTEECFYQRAKIQDSLEIEYQVIDSLASDINVNSELDITFHLYSPGGRELLSDYKKSDGTHRFVVREDGDHKFCFSNHHSLFSVKTVYFEVYVDNDSEDDEGWEEYSFSPELLYNDTMDQIKISMAKVREDLNKIKHHQDQLKAIESRDRNLQEHNFTRVNHFSIVYVIVMLSVGCIQVVCIRALFDERSKIHKFFQSNNSHNFLSPRS